MRLIKEEEIKRELKGKEFVFEFGIEKEGIYGIEILTFAKSWWQNLLKLKSFFKDDDLTDLPLDYSRIPSERKREEAKRLVQCVLKNKKRKNWKNILFPFIFLLILGFGTWSLNQIDFFEPKLSKKEYLLSEISQFPAVLWEEKKNELIFFNSRGKIVKKIPVEDFNFYQIFQIPRDFQKFNLIYTWPKVLEHPSNVFYFFVSASQNCGQNCRWVFLRSDLKKHKFQIIDDNVFGKIIDFYPSSNFQKIALMSYVFGGFCNSKSNLEIIDLKNYKKTKIERILG